MSMIQVIGALQLGLIFSFVAIGVYLSFRTLQFPDMTVDGSFPLGAAVCATVVVQGGDPYLATILAVFISAGFGVVTAWLSTHLKVLNLLAGILVMTALYSINLRIMGRPNIALIGETHVFSALSAYREWVWLALLVFVSLISFALRHFLLSHKGLALRATGNNARMARAQGINDDHMIWLGLGVSNGLVGLSGALFAQLNGFADINMGIGTIITGLAAVIVGEALFKTQTIFRALLACVIGSVLYQLVIAMALNVGGFGLQASDLKLVTAILVGMAMLLPTLKTRLSS